MYKVFGTFTKAQRQAGYDFFRSLEENRDNNLRRYCGFPVCPIGAVIKKMGGDNTMMCPSSAYAILSALNLIATSESYDAATKLQFGMPDYRGAAVRFITANDTGKIENLARAMGV